MANYPPRYRVTPIQRLADDELDWQARAECRRHDPELWHPKSAGTAFSKAAVAICLHHCPVMEECRAWALRNQEPHGIWGGLTEQEREAIRKRIQRKSLQQKGIYL